MTITVSWLDDRQTCILMIYDRQWTWNDFQAAYKQVNQHFSSVPHKVDFIIDIHQAALPPPNGLSYFKQVSENQHANLGRIIVVGAPVFIRGIVNLLTTVYRGRYQPPDFTFVPNLEEARKLIVPAHTSDK